MLGGKPGRFALHDHLRRREVRQHVERRAQRHEQTVAEERRRQRHDRERDQYLSTWKTFETLARSGKARSIGVSNFKPAHLDRLLAEAAIPPVANQIQLNPRIGRPEQRAYNRDHGIVTVAWRPLGRGGDLLAEPTLATIAARYGKSPAQVVLRWFVQLGVVPIPRSTNRERLTENLDVFDFALTDQEVSAIAALDTGAEERVDSDMQGH